MSAGAVGHAAGEAAPESPRRRGGRTPSSRDLGMSGLGTRKELAK